MLQRLSSISTRTETSLNQSIEKAEEYKKIVCEWACIDEDETQIELIDGCYTETHYNYKIA